MVELADDRQIVIKDGFVKQLRSQQAGYFRHRDGEVLKGRVYESGGYPDSLPPKVQEILHPDQPPAQPAPWTGFAFHSFMYVID